MSAVGSSRVDCFEERNAQPLGLGAAGHVVRCFGAQIGFEFRVRTGRETARE